MIQKVLGFLQFFLQIVFPRLNKSELSKYNLFIVEIKIPHFQYFNSFHPFPIIFTFTGFS